MTKRIAFGPAPGDCHFPNSSSTASVTRLDQVWRNLQGIDVLKMHHGISRTCQTGLVEANEILVIHPINAGSDPSSPVQVSKLPSRSGATRTSRQFAVLALQSLGGWNPVATVV